MSRPVAALFLFLFALPAPHAAERLLTEAYSFPFQSVSTLHATTPDRIVFSGNLSPDDDNRSGLYSIDLIGGAAIPLGPRSVNGVTEVSVRGQRAVYQLRGGPGEAALWSAATDGSTPAVKLTPEAAVSDLLDSATESTLDRVLFVHRGDTDEPRKLYIAPRDGSTPPTLLASAALPTLDLHSARSNSLGDRIFFLSQTDADACCYINTELFSVPATGGPAVRLNSDLPALGGDVSSYLTSTYFVLGQGTQRWAIYRADQVADQQFDLFTVPADGSAAPVLISGSRPSGGDVTLFGLTPNGQGVVFSGDLETDGNEELFVSATDGSSARSRLTDGTGMTGRRIYSFVVSPVESRVVFRSDLSGIPELYTVRTNGLGKARLNPALAPGGSVRSYLLSNDGANVVFEADIDGSGIVHLWSVPVQGGTATRLTPTTLAVGSGCNGVCSGQSRLLPGGERVLVEAYVSGEGRGLLNLGLGGNDQIWLGGSLAQTRDAGNSLFKIDVSSGPGQHLLTRQTADGSLDPAPVHGALPAFGEMQADFIPMPDGSRVAFRADLELDGKMDLYIADDDRHQVSFSLSTQSVTEGDSSVPLLIRLSEASVAAVTVGWIVSGTASAGDVAMPAGNSIVIPAGATEVDLPIAALADAVLEGPESLVLTLDLPADNLGSPSVFTLDIADVPPTEVGLRVKIEEGEGAIGNRVTSMPAGIDCPGQCLASFVPGTVVTLSAEAGQGSMFVGFFGAGCSGQAEDCVLTLNGTQDVDAVFDNLSAGLSVLLAGDGAGVVTSDPIGIDCPGTCADDFAVFETITLNAAASPGSVFTGWSGACTGLGPCVLDMQLGPHAATAEFMLETSTPLIFFSGFE